jgi:hypothetical protein
MVLSIMKQVLNRSNNWNNLQWRKPLTKGKHLPKMKRDGPINCLKFFYIKNWVHKIKKNTTQLRVKDQWISNVHENNCYLFHKTYKPINAFCSQNNKVIDNETGGTQLLLAYINCFKVNFQFLANSNIHSWWSFTVYKNCWYKNWSPTIMNYKQLATTVHCSLS